MAAGQRCGRLSGPGTLTSRTEVGHAPWFSGKLPGDSNPQLWAESTGSAASVGLLSFIFKTCLSNSSAGLLEAGMVSLSWCRVWSIVGSHGVGWMNEFMWHVF